VTVIKCEQALRADAQGDGDGGYLRPHLSPPVLRIEARFPHFAAI
jgi:hypothetical protein